MWLRISLGWRALKTPTAQTPGFCGHVHTQNLTPLTLHSRGGGGGGGTPYVMCDTYVPRFWPPFFTLAGSSTIFLGYFSHPPTAKLSFGVQKLPIFTKIDLFGPKFNFFLDLFGSNFQRPAAHPHQFSGQVPPPRGFTTSGPDPLGFDWEGRAASRGAAGGHNGLPPLK